MGVKFRLPLLCTAIIAVATAGIIWIILSRDPPLNTGDDQVSDGLPFEIEDRSKHGFVGWQVCAECHKERVHEFQFTRHFQALQLASEIEFPRGFQPGASSFIPPNSPVRFDASLQPTPAITVTPRQNEGASPTISPITYVYGAGAGTDEVYFTRKGDRIFELPVAWLHRDDCWGATPFDPYGTGDLSRPLAPQCLECHTVWVDHVRGSLNEYGPFQTELLGVSCERCHGPAAAHVAHHRAHPGEKVAAHIVQPKTLNRDRQMDLCAQCHTNTVRHRRPPFSYRPGEPLENSFLVLEMQVPEDDRVANQVRYLKESRCYQESDSLTCVTCHDPHRRPNREDPLASSQSCWKCHKSEQCGARSRSPSPIQDDCVSCHMPKRNKVQVNFETAAGDLVFPAPRWEHRIGVYPKAEQEALWTWLGTQYDDDSRQRHAELATELARRWLQVANEARTSHRALIAIDAYKTSLRFAESADVRQHLSEILEEKRQTKALWFQGISLKREQRLEDAIRVLETLQQRLPNFALAEHELGTLYAATGRPQDAIEMLQQAWNHDPNDPGAPAMLGWLEFLNGRPTEALEYYRQAAAVEPWSERLEQMQGECLAKLGRWGEAVQAYLRALTIDPKHTESARSLRQILRERYTPKDALPFAINAVQVTEGKQLELLLTLAEIYRDLEKYQQARQIAVHIRTLSRLSENPALPQFEALERFLQNSSASRR